MILASPNEWRKLGFGIFRKPLQCKKILEYFPAQLHCFHLLDTVLQILCVTGLVQNFLIFHCRGIITAAFQNQKLPTCPASHSVRGEEFSLLINTSFL